MAGSRSWPTAAGTPPRHHPGNSPWITARWLHGLRHPLVGRALRLLHGRLDHPWTLAKLAREAGASRSSLSEKFTAVVGLPPMQYLLRWRMQVAAGRLADGTAKVYAVAREVGYESESAFSRAFKREVGQSPAVWRAQRLNRSAAAALR